MKKKKKKRKEGNIRRRYTVAYLLHAINVEPQEKPSLK
jgi:hypothetical protein